VTNSPAYVYAPVFDDNEFISTPEHLNYQSHLQSLADNGSSSAAKIDNIISFMESSSSDQGRVCNRFWIKFQFWTKF